MSHDAARPALAFFNPHQPANPNAMPNDMLGQDPPHEGDDHEEELIQRPEPDQFGVIQMRRDHVFVG